MKGNGWTAVWELFGPDDWAQAKDLARQHAEKLAEMQRQWLIEAEKYKVLPIDDRVRGKSP
jgi:arylsulfatase A-like enzyme